MIRKTVGVLRRYSPLRAAIASTLSCDILCRELRRGSSSWPTTVSMLKTCSVKVLTALKDIQVWAPQQAQAFSVQNGRNALLALVLPLAFENTMLFEATIAMTRAAWVLRRCSDPFADKMLLRHRGLALMQLRSTLVSPDHRHSDLVLMTMSTLLTLNVCCALDCLQGKKLGT
jgi:hypothetical protein